MKGERSSFAEFDEKRELADLEAQRENSGQEGEKKEEPKKDLSKKKTTFSRSRILRGPKGDIERLPYPQEEKRKGGSVKVERTEGGGTISFTEDKD